LALLTGKAWATYWAKEFEIRKAKRFF